MSLIDYTDKAIMRILLDQIQQMNPWVKIGETLTRSSETVSGGKVLNLYDEQPPANFVKLTNGAGYINRPPSAPARGVSTQPITLSLNDIEHFRTSGLQKLNLRLTHHTWLHPHSLEIPAREWLEKYKLGDMIAVEVMDGITFQRLYLQTPLTQPMIDDHSDVIFRFALSDR